MKNLFNLAKYRDVVERPQSRLVLPLIIAGLLLLLPVMFRHGFHGFPNFGTLLQHLYFEVLAGLGGLWAASFCKHWRHRVILMVLIDVFATSLLVSLVG